MTAGRALEEMELNPGELELRVRPLLGDLHRRSADRAYLGGVNWRLDGLLSCLDGVQATLELGDALRQLTHRFPDRDLLEKLEYVRHGNHEVLSFAAVERALLPPVFNRPNDLVATREHDREPQNQRSRSPDSEDHE